MRANTRARDDRLNRAVQAVLRGAAGTGERTAARCALGVLTRLWRRGVWRDARTANAVADAALHADDTVALAALKFFLGEDEAGGADSDDEDGGAEGGRAARSGPSKLEMYRATKLGTTATKKRKQARLKRVQRAVDKAARKEKAGGAEGFAAIHLLHDPQVREGLGGIRRWEGRA